MWIDFENQENVLAESGDDCVEFAEEAMDDEELGEPEEYLVREKTDSPSTYESSVYFFHYILYGCIVLFCH